MWTWAIVALAFVLVSIGSFYAASVIWPPTSPADPEPSPPSAPTSPGAATPSPAPEGLGWTAVPHVQEGAFLDPAYAEGAREFGVKSKEETEFVGASADAGVVAINVNSEVRGIDTGTTETVWTYQSSSCSEGSWDGIALCVDANLTTLLPGETADFIGLDLATGEPTFRFTPPGSPWVGRYATHFIGSDEAHGYFTISLDSDAPSGVEQHVLALTKDGQQSWLTALKSGQAPRSAALVANDKIALDLAGRIMMLDRGTGAAALDVVDEGSHPTFTWEGWTTYDNGGGNRTKTFDQEGTQTGEFAGLDRFIPVDGRGITVGVPVYETEALTRTDSVYPDAWAVTSQGEPVLQNVIYEILDTEGKMILDDAILEGISGDGSLFLSDQSGGAIHDAVTGDVIGGFTKPHNANGPAIIDGIAVHAVSIGDVKGVFVLLPGAAEN